MHLFARANATINSIVAVLLVVALVAVKSKKYQLHKTLMMAAMLMSVENYRRSEGGPESPCDGRRVSRENPPPLDPPIDQKGMIPESGDVLQSNCLYVGEVHHHAVQGRFFVANDIADQRDLECVAMPMQMAALALMIGNAVTGVELQSAGDLHVKDAILDGTAL